MLLHLFSYSFRRSLIPTVGWDALNLEAQFAHVTSLAASSWMKVAPFVSRRPLLGASRKQTASHFDSAETRSKVCACDFAGRLVVAMSGAFSLRLVLVGPSFLSAGNQPV